MKPASMPSNLAQWRLPRGAAPMRPATWRVWPTPWHRPGDAAPDPNAAVLAGTLALLEELGLDEGDAARHGAARITPAWHPAGPRHAPPQQPCWTDCRRRKNLSATPRARAVSGNAEDLRRLLRNRSARSSCGVRAAGGRLALSARTAAMAAAEREDWRASRLTSTRPQPPGYLAAEVGAGGPGLPPAAAARHYPAHRASLLDERRSDREHYIESAKAELRQRWPMPASGPMWRDGHKHIYSIWKKMQRKGGEFDALYDIRAVRVLVDDAVLLRRAGRGARCGRPSPASSTTTSPALGQPPIPAHRSGRSGRQDSGSAGPQHDMHAHAELGVAAHWRCKEGGGVDASFERKIAWMRQLLEAGRRRRRRRALLAGFRTDLIEDRVYL